MLLYIERQPFLAAPHAHTVLYVCMPLAVDYRLAACALKLIIGMGACWPGLGEWATRNDPILQRYGVGALARSAVSSPAAFAAVQESGGLRLLASALNCDDAQAQCFAAGALGVSSGWAHSPRCLAKARDV